MSRIGTILVAGALPLMITGCQSSGSVEAKGGPVPAYRQNLELKYPVVSINLIGGRGSGSADLFLAELRSTAMFTEVRDGGGGVPVRLDVLYRITDRSSSGAGGVAKGVISGASLGVIPTRYENVYTLSVAVVVNGVRIKDYQFVREATSTLFLLSDPWAKEKEVCRALLADLLASMQADELFEKTVPGLLEDAQATCSRPGI